MLLLMTNRKSQLSIDAKINDIGWPWKAITYSDSKHVRLSEPTTKIWMKIDPYYQQGRCSPMTVDSGNIRIMRIFPGDVASNNSGVMENMDFQGFRTLRFRHLRKWDQHYYIILFSPLSPFQFHWPQNIWSWMTILRSIFNLHHYEPFSAIRLIFIVKVFTEYFCYMMSPAEVCGSGPWKSWSAEYCGSAKHCGSFVDEKLRALCRRNPNE